MTAARTEGSAAAASASVDRPWAAASSSINSRSGAAPRQPAEQRLTPFVQLQGGARAALPADHPQHGRPPLVAGQRPLLQDHLRREHQPARQQVGVGGPLHPAAAPEEPGRLLPR